MSRYLLHHRHTADDCGVVFTSFKGYQSPLRHRPTLASCRSGGHEIWWTMDADSEEDALRLLTAHALRIRRRTRRRPAACIGRDSPRFEDLALLGRFA